MQFTFYEPRTGKFYPEEPTNRNVYKIRLITIASIARASRDSIDRNGLIRILEEEDSYCRFLEVNK